MPTIIAHSLYLKMQNKLLQEQRLVFAKISAGNAWSCTNTENMPISLGELRKGIPSASACNNSHCN